MNTLYLLAAAGSTPVVPKPTFQYVWEQLEGPGLAIIVVLVLFSTCAWAVMATKAWQMRRGHCGRLVGIGGGARRR